MLQRNVPGPNWALFWNYAKIWIVYSLFLGNCAGRAKSFAKQLKLRNARDEPFLRVCIGTADAKFLN